MEIEKWPKPKHFLQKMATVSKKLKKASADKKRIHVIPRTSTGEWAVKREGSSRASSVSKSKSSAVTEAKKMAKSGKYNSVIVHAKDGTIVHVDIMNVTEDVKVKIGSAKTRRTSKKVVGAKRKN